jgi:hypothetical protein
MPYLGEKNIFYKAEIRGQKLRSSNYSNYLLSLKSYSKKGRKQEL